MSNRADCHEMYDAIAAGVAIGVRHLEADDKLHGVDPAIVCGLIGFGLYIGINAMAGYNITLGIIESGITDSLKIAERYTEKERKGEE